MILYVRVLNQAPQLIEICLLRYIKGMSRDNEREDQQDPKDQQGQQDPKDPKDQKNSFSRWRLEELVTLIEKGKLITDSGNGENQGEQDDKTVESCQETIDTWAESMIPESMTLCKHLIFIGIMILIVVLFFLDQFGFPVRDWSWRINASKWLMDRTGRSTHSIIHFVLYAIPPIAAAFGGSFKLTERQYNDIMADMGDEKKAFKQSKKYRSLRENETIADAVTIVSVFIAAITALAS